MQEYLSIICSFFRAQDFKYLMVLGKGSFGKVNQSNGECGKEYKNINILIL